jgi:hypothetical protein
MSSSVMRRPTQKRGRVGGSVRGSNGGNVVVKTENKVVVKTNGRKPRSAYMLFTKSELSDEEETMKESGVKFMKIRGDTWKSMDEEARAPYVEAARKEKEDYKKWLSSGGDMGTKTMDSSPTPRKPNDYCCGSKKKLLALRNECENLRKTNTHLYNESNLRAAAVRRNKADLKKERTKNRNLTSCVSVLKKGCEESLLMMKEEYEEKLRKCESAYKQNSVSDVDCTICCCPIEGDLGVTSLDCGHKFHTSCILNWFSGGKNTCCNCRHQQEGAKAKKNPRCLVHGEENCQTCYHITFDLMEENALQPSDLTFGL